MPASLCLQNKLRKQSRNTLGQLSFDNSFKFVNSASTYENLHEKLFILTEPNKIMPFTFCTDYHVHAIQHYSISFFKKIATLQDKFPSKSFVLLNPQREMKSPFSFVFFKLSHTFQNVTNEGYLIIALFADSQRLLQSAGPHPAMDRKSVT